MHACMHACTQATFHPQERCVRAVSAMAVKILTHAIVQPRLGSPALSICTWTSFDAGSRYGHCIYMRPMPGRRAIKAKGSLHYCTILFIFLDKINIPDENIRFVLKFLTRSWGGVLNESSPRGWPVHDTGFEWSND